MMQEFNFNPLKHNALKAKKFAQYFTNIKIAIFMADMINDISSHGTRTLRILDAGAGEGILGIQAVIRCIELGYKNIELTCYEIDDELHPLIKEHANTLKNSLETKDVRVDIQIISADFVLSKSSKKYDIAIINPPYFKYSVKASSYADATSDLFKGNPNIYASFMAICIESLRTKGILISITPRSFTNGLYFKGFRNFLYENVSFEHIHIFKSRDKVFKDSQVLQECVICKMIKTKQAENVAISSSNSDVDLASSIVNTYSKNLIIDMSNDLKMIHIPENKREASILIQANSLESTFEKSGYFISTGPVVEHRTREFITEHNSNPDIKIYAPLIRPHNVNPMEVRLLEHGKNAYFLINKLSTKHLLKNKTYILLKRFSTKDEKKRLIAGILHADTSTSEYVGIGNKINYIGLKDEELSTEEAFGLSAVLNSKFMDDYFRCFSGNTQVNASEIRVMKFPSRRKVQCIGNELQDKKLVEDMIEEVVLKNLFREDLKIEQR